MRVYQINHIFFVLDYVYLYCIIECEQVLVVVAAWTNLRFRTAVL